MRKIQSNTFTMKIFCHLLKPPFNFYVNTSMAIWTTPLPTANWPIFLVLLPELQASPPAKSSCPSPSTTVEPEVSITPPRLPMIVTELLLITISLTSLLTSCAPLIKPIFCIIAPMKVSGSML